METLKDYKIKVSFPVSWSDMDAMRHLNNVAYLRYFEDSRIAYYNAIGLGHKMNHSDILGVVKSMNCEYIQPITFPDIVEIGSKVIKIVEHGFILEHYVLSESNGLCAFGETEVAILNANSLSTIKIPQTIIAEIRKIDKIQLEKYGSK